MAARGAAQQGFKDFFRKKIGLVLVALVLALATVSADDRIVSPDQLPQ